MKKEKEKEKNSSWKQRELLFLVLYAVVFYCVIIRRSLQLSSEYYGKLYGLRLGWLAGRFNDASDAQWRNFRSNLPILTIVFGLYSVLPQILRMYFKFKVRGMSVVWLLISLTYLLYLHGACIIFILSIVFLNYLLVKMSARTKYFSFFIWAFNIAFLICNRVYEGYSFSEIGQPLAYLDHFRGSFRWQICFNFVVLRMISYGYDYHWAHRDSHFDHEKHSQHCHTCKTGCMCYVVLQERSVPEESYSFITYLCYLVYAPLYLAGPIISFNAFASQLDTPQNNYSISKVALYGLRWFMNLLLMELMTHFFYYNAFAISGLWKKLSPFDVFIIGYGALLATRILGRDNIRIPNTPKLYDTYYYICRLSLAIFYLVLNFMWLKFLLIWRYFRLWSLINGIEPPENMPRCINNCYNLESFWKSWHASFNKWLVRYMYIPLGGSRRKLVNVWVVFTFVAIWHDLEWKLLSWAWLTCIFFIPEMAIKSAANSFQAESAVGKFIHRELRAFAGAITITCLMVANLVGYVIGPSGMNWLVSRFLNREGLPVLGGMFMTFYIGTKLMLHIQEMKTSNRQGNQQ